MPPVEPRAAGATPAERYRVLLDIGHTLAGTLGSEDLYRAIYHETARVLEAAGFYVATYDQARDLATVVFYADRGEERSVSVSYRGSDSVVIRTGEGGLVDDRESVPSLLVLGDERETLTRSAITAPLMHKGRILGVLSAQSYRQGAYTEEDLELLQGIADIAAVAMENARHVAELERRRREAEMIEEIGRVLTSSLEIDHVLEKVAEGTLSVLAADGASVWLLEGTRVRVAASEGEIRLPVGMEWDVDGPIYDRLVRDKEHVVIDDLERSDLIPEPVRKHLKAGSGVAVPLRVGGEVVGALSAGSASARAFDHEDVAVLRRIASQGSVALQNARLHASLHALSLTDPLTRLPNRRHLQIHLEREVAAASRGRQVVVVMFDLDNFKGYNDRAGHLAGDEALRAFGRILSEENRAMNLVARYGGDEFISILSDTPLNGAQGYVHRVRRRVEADPILGPNDITVSTGLAAWDSDTMTSMDDVIQAADSDLYREKGDRPGHLDHLDDG